MLGLRLIHVGKDKFWLNLYRRTAGHLKHWFLMASLASFTLACMYLVVTKSVVINLSSQNLTRIPNTTVIPATVTELILNRNDIVRIFADDLTPFTELRKLTMSGVGIKVIEDGAFDHNKKLEFLDLKNNENELEYLPISFGAPKRYLTEMSFWAAFNENIRNFDFRHLIALRKLNIGACRLGSFKPSTLPEDLDRLVLNSNPLNHLPDFVPYTPNLKSLSASQTQLSYIPDYAISGLTKLTTLQLRYNNLRTLPNLYHLPLATLYLEGNPLECNQSLCWVRMWNYRKPSALSVVAVCEYPMASSGTELMQVHPIDMGCFEGKTCFAVKWFKKQRVSEFQRTWASLIKTYQTNGPDNAYWLFGSL